MASITTRQTKGTPLTNAELDANFTGLNSDNTVLAAEVALKAYINSPTFTGTTQGITRSMIGLGNVNNTSDLLKPISIATQLALDGFANVENTKDIDKPLSTATQSALATKAAIGHTHSTAGVQGLSAALDLLAPLASPTFTGNVSGVTKVMVGLSNVDNTSDSNKPVSTATQSAMAFKAGLIHTHTVSALIDLSKGSVGLGSVDNTSDISKPISLATSNALLSKQDVSSKNQTNGYAGLDGSGKIAFGQLPTIVPTWASITGKPTTRAGYGITDAGFRHDTSSAQSVFGDSGLNQFVTCNYAGGVYFTMASTPADGQRARILFINNRLDNKVFPGNAGKTIKINGHDVAPGEWVNMNKTINTIHEFVYDGSIGCWVY